MSKNLKARIVSGGLLAILFFNCLSIVHGTPTIRAEKQSIEEQITEESPQAVALFEGYTTTDLNVRDYPSIEKGQVIDTLQYNSHITYCLYNNNFCDWGVILNPTENHEFGFIYLKYVSDEKQTWDGPILNNYDGVNYGPSGKETYYNLPMNQVVSNMKNLGYEGEYWIRSDGAKMFGDCVMVAADLNIYPKGTIIETSLGKSMVCDTGDFCKMNTGVSIDIATSWK